MKHMTNILTILAILAFVGCNKTPDNPGGTNTPTEVEHDVKAYTSTASRSLTFQASGVDFATVGNMSPNTIRLRPETTYQFIDGFGAAITGSTCYNLKQMSQENRTAFLKEVFDTVSGLGYSYVRVSIGCSDFSLSEYTCCDVPGDVNTNFALTNEETQYVIPILREILEINPTLKVMGSPWTAPRWMKVSQKGGSTLHNSWTSGHLNTIYYGEYANYFVKWIRAFQALCVPIYSITMQNEPLNGGNSASMLMEWDEQIDFIKILGPKLQEAGLSPKVYVFDHNYNYDGVGSQQQYPLHIYDDATAAQYVAGAAYHHYGGNSNELNQIHNAVPYKELVFSEGSIGSWSNGRDLNATFCGAVEESIDLVSKWCKGVIVWNLMLDMNGAPNRPNGCTTCYGAVDISSNYQTISRNNHYYEIGHLSKVVKPGAIRIKAEGYSPNGLMYQAFKNPDGSYAMVILNKTANEISFVIEDNNHSFTFSVPGKAATSLRW
jgi:glucosylceramidase